MTLCLNCKLSDNCIEHDLKKIRGECTNYIAKVRTNADKIRAMSDEELADLLNLEGWNCPPGDCPGEDYCYDCWLKWLKHEVDE